jgi:hypothetical protein
LSNTLTGHWGHFCNTTFKLKKGFFLILKQTLGVFIMIGGSVIMFIGVAQKTFKRPQDTKDNDVLHNDTKHKNTTFSITTVDDAECRFYWASFVLVLRVFYAELLLMLSINYAEYHLCWVSLMLSITYAEYHLCWVSLMLSITYGWVCDYVHLN